jgi:hypothetical protein
LILQDKTGGLHFQGFYSPVLDSKKILTKILILYTMFNP